MQLVEVNIHRNIKTGNYSLFGLCAFFLMVNWMCAPQCEIN